MSGTYLNIKNQNKQSQKEKPHEPCPHLLDKIVLDAFKYNREVVYITVINMDKDSKWIVEHFEELVNRYGGLYIAVVNGEIISVGDDPKEVEDKAKSKYPTKNPRF